MNVIFGASGHAKEIFQLATANNLSIDYFVENSKVGSYLNNVKIISEAEFLTIKPETAIKVFIGIGNSKIRSKIYKLLKDNGFNDSQFPTLIHPTIKLKTEDKIDIGIGCVINIGCILTTEIFVGNFVHININSTISHESKIGDFVTVSPGCCICGNVKIGSFCFLGAGAVIIDKITVAEEATIGAGGVVIRDINDKGTYCGVPVKKIM